MAAQLKDGGRYPAVQRLGKAEFATFVEVCSKAPKPSQSLRDLMASAAVGMISLDGREGISQ